MRVASFIQSESIDELRHRLIVHPLYPTLNTLDNLRLFMEHHVFAVWDFMSIVKSLQRELTCVTIPWQPPEDVDAARLINEIVLEEESDERPDGSYASHLHLYLDAMVEVGADTGSIRRFLEAVSAGYPVALALDQSEAPFPSRAFVKSTFDVLNGTPLHVRAAALFYGREDLIPKMFEPMVREMQASGQPCGGFVYYLERHIELDGGKHSLLAEGLLERACGGDAQHKDQAQGTALRVLRARIDLWDGILSAVHARTPSE